MYGLILLPLLVALTGCTATSPTRLTPEQAHFIHEYQRASAAFQAIEDERFRRYQRSLRDQDDYLSRGRW